MTTRQVEKVETHTETVCDRCGQTGRFSYGAGGRCGACGRDVCGRCNVPDPDDPGDYPVVWCKQCWDVGAPYRARIAEECEEHDARCEKIRKTWAALCDKEE